MEEARWDYFDKHRDIADMVTEQGIAHATVHISINYHHPSVLGDVIRIETGICKKSQRSITFGQKIFIGDSDRLVADAEVVNVFFNKKGGNIVDTGSEIFAAWEDLSNALVEENKKNPGSFNRSCKRRNDP
jgi:thioesterase-3